MLFDNPTDESPAVNEPYLVYGLAPLEETPISSYRNLISLLVYTSQHLLHLALKHLLLFH